MRVGIEAINVYGGAAALDLGTLAAGRGLDPTRLQNLLMAQKTVALPCEDPVTFGVNAAKPLIDELTPEARSRIELVVVGTESGLDFGKSMSTYIHDYLGLSRKCRSFEVKQACYATTAALHIAASLVMAQGSPGAKALIVGTDAARPVPGSYAEATQGAAAVALLVGEEPKVLELDFGASGHHSFEVFDTCRPLTDTECGDPDLSLLTYLECAEHSLLDYLAKVPDADLVTTFDYLSFHTPFGAMVKGAHRTLLRKLAKMAPAAIEEDFNRRLKPSFAYCQVVGNVYSAALYVALCGLLDTVPISGRRRIGLFSYGSGCCSEFFSGVVDETSKREVARRGVDSHLASRRMLTMGEYERLLALNDRTRFGVESYTPDHAPYRDIFASQLDGRRRLILKQIKGYHREYDWS